MAIYKRGHIYWCEWEIGGKRTRETTGTSDKAAAQEWHDRRRAEIWRISKLGDARSITWDEAAVEWITEHGQYKKNFESDRQRLALLTEHLTGQPITKTSTDKLLELRKLILKDRKPATANRYLALTSGILNYARGKGHNDSVPKIPYMPEKRERFRWLTRDKACDLIAELPEHLAALTRFALATGLRRANITGLTWQNVDTERGIAWVWPDESKSGKPIAVPLNGDALVVLQTRRGIDARYVFTYRGQPIYHTTTAAWHKALIRANIDPGLTFHDLRHTWASWHVMGGTPLDVLRQLGGWADMTMVLRYAHLAPGYVAGYAENTALIPTVPPQHPSQNPTQ